MDERMNERSIDQCWDLANRIDFVPTALTAARTWLTTFTRHYVNYERFVVPLIELCTGHKAHFVFDEKIQYADM
jgi:hypothetical protein